MEEDPRILVRALRRNRRGKLALQTAIIHLCCSVVCIIIGIFAMAIIKSSTIERVYGLPLWVGLLVSRALGCCCWFIVEVSLLGTIFCDVSCERNANFRRAYFDMKFAPKKCIRLKMFHLLCFYHAQLQIKKP